MLVFFSFFSECTLLPFTDFKPAQLPVLLQGQHAPPAHSEILRNSQREKIQFKPLFIVPVAGTWSVLRRHFKKCLYADE